MQAIYSGEMVLSSMILNPHPFADQIKRHPLVEVLPMTRDTRPEAMARALDWIAINQSSRR